MQAAEDPDGEGPGGGWPGRELLQPVTEAELRRAVGRPPVTGAWHPGEPVGHRRFAHVGALDTEFGERIDDVRIAYETWGRLSPDQDNAVLVFHALTGDSHAAGGMLPGHRGAGWWNGQIGPGLAIDTDRYFVLCANILGGCQGTTGPSTFTRDGRPWGSRFPYITIRDMVHVMKRLADQLGIEHWHTAVGPSMGGMQALEWAVEYPDSIDNLIVIACPAATSADRIAANTIQIDLIRNDPDWLGGDYYDLPPGRGPWRGMALARRLAMTTYRTAEEFNSRFDRRPQSELSPYGGGGRFAIESYLDVQGNRFTRRFDAGTYVTLEFAINSHDVARGRGTLADVLSTVPAKALVIGVDSDRLYDIEEQRRIARFLPGHLGGRQAVAIHSPYGHDSFLIEREAIGRQLRRVLG